MTADIAAWLSNRPAMTSWVAGPLLVERVGGGGLWLLSCFQ